MSGRNNWKNIKTKLSPEARERSKARASKLLAQALALDELRKSRGVTQEDLAKAMDSYQTRISQLSNQDDMLISTLKSYISALGGRLKLTAEFSDGEVEIGQFKSD